MHKRIGVLSLLVGGLVVLSFPAKSENCNPRDFAFKDYQELRFDHTVYLNALSLMDANSAENKSTNFGLDIVVPGAPPLNITGQEASAASRHILQYSQQEFNEQKSIQFVKTAFRFEGAAFQACLNANDPVKISYGSDAAVANEFFLNVGWEPREVKAPDEAELEIKAIGAKVDNINIKKSTLLKNQVATFIVNGSNSGFSISVSVAGKAQAPLVFPPKIPTQDFEVVETPMVDEHGNSTIGVASEEGAGGGPGPNNTQVCASAAPDGILFPSTIFSRLSIRTVASDFIPQKDISNSRVACAVFHTNGGPGKNTRYEIRGTGYVLQLLPKKK